MTRPEADSQRFVSMLPPLTLARLKVCMSPAMEIVPTAGGLRIGDNHGLIFTSANAVATAAALTDRRDLPCFCVGARTTEMATDAGWSATQRGATAEALVQSLIDAPPDGPLLHLHGVHTRGDIAKQLTAAGIPATGQVIYDQKLRSMSPEVVAVLQGDLPVIIPLFSPRSACHFAQQYRAAAPVYLAALSPAVAAPLAHLKATALHVSEAPNSAAMVDLIEKVVNQVCRVESERGAQ